MRFLFKLFVWVLILLPLPVLGGIYLCIEDHPLIQRDVRLTPDEVQRAKRLFQEHDPRKLKDGEIKTVSVSQRDLSLASNYLVHLLGRGGSVVTVKDGHLAAQATLQLPKNPLGAYVNGVTCLRVNWPLRLLRHQKFPRIHSQMAPGVGVGPVAFVGWGLFQEPRLLELHCQQQRHP